MAKHLYLVSLEAISLTYSVIDMHAILKNDLDVVTHLFSANNKSSDAAKSRKYSFNFFQRRAYLFKALPSCFATFLVAPERTVYFFCSDFSEWSWISALPYLPYHRRRD